MVCWLPGVFQLNLWFSSQSLLLSQVSLHLEKTYSVTFTGNNVRRSINVLTDESSGGEIFCIGYQQCSSLEEIKTIKINTHYLSAIAFTKRSAQQTLQNEMCFKVTNQEKLLKLGILKAITFFMRVLNAMINVYMKLSDCSSRCFRNTEFHRHHSHCMESSIRNFVVLVPLSLSRTVDTLNL